MRNGGSKSLVVDTKVSIKDNVVSYLRFASSD